MAYRWQLVLIRPKCSHPWHLNLYPSTAQQLVSHHWRNMSSIYGQKVTSSHHVHCFFKPPCTLVVVKSWNIIHYSDWSQALCFRLSSWQWNLECSVFHATVHSMDMKAIMADYSKSFWFLPQYSFIKYSTSSGENYIMRSLLCNINSIK